MTSSDVTMMYFDLCGASRRPPLFLSVDLPEGGAVVRLVNGRELPYEGEAGKGDAYGVIARVTPSGRDAGRKWLFCAGLGRSGTEAAANYLSDNWRDLATVVGDRDFVTVV